MPECCDSIASIVEALANENKALTQALVEQSGLLCRLLLKSMDAALTPEHSQIERVLGEQRTEQSRNVDPMPPPILQQFPSPMTNDEPLVGIDIPKSSGGYGA